MKRSIYFLAPFLCLFIFGQTDETIFREFRFDFTTPGARANALGKAFVGLADEATAAYNNPAGLTVLEYPEVTFEYRDVTSRYAFLKENHLFDLRNGSVLEPETSLKRLTFASFAFSRFNTNFSLFYVNQLDYSRELNEETTNWLNRVGYEFTYANFHRAQMALDTFGLGFGRKYSRLSFGAAIGFSRFNFDYKYRTSLTSEDLDLTEYVDSNAKGIQTEFTFVLGILYYIYSDLKIGVTYKNLPAFQITEDVITLEQPDGHAIPISFKVPDSFTIGLSYLPSERITLLLDLNRIWYNQLGGKNFTVISGNNYTSDDYSAPAVTEVHFGFEYLFPYRGHIFALRTGAYLNPDHKTRFIGNTISFSGQIQSFVFNTGEETTETGFTAGLGYVWKNKLQIDLAIANESNQFKSIIASVLYRFGKK